MGSIELTPLEYELLQTFRQLTPEEKRWVLTHNDGLQTIVENRDDAVTEPRRN